jgi:hypothetical protein
MRWLLRSVKEISKRMYWVHAPQLLRSLQWFHDVHPLLYSSGHSWQKMPKRNIGEKSHRFAQLHALLWVAQGGMQLHVMASLGLRVLSMPVRKLRRR